MDRLKKFDSNDYVCSAYCTLDQYELLVRLEDL